MDPLVKIFQSKNGDVRLRLLRFFLVNSEEAYKIDEIEFNTKLRRVSLTSDLQALVKVGFIEIVAITKTTRAYQLNQEFKYNDALYNLVFDFKSLDKEAILEKIKKIGRLKLVTFTGIFIDEEDIEVDLLIVGDNLKPREVNKFLEEMNASFAEKLRVVVMDIEEFDYRKKMFDKFLHIVLDSNRITLLDKISDVEI